MAPDGQAPPSSEGEPLAPQELAELSALADGSLDPGRRPAVERRIAASSELRALYERERDVVTLLHEARSTDRAPDALRQRLTDRGRARQRPRTRRQFGFGVAITTGVAAVLAVVLALPGGTPGAPSLSEAAALALRGPAGPAPAPDPASPGARLGADVQEVYFPNWSRSFHWRAVGQRTDRLDGRKAVTVYYDAPDGRRVAYTIVAAPALQTPRGEVSRRGDYTLVTLNQRGRTIVTWRRDGRTCVLSGADTPATVLTRLAAWRGRGERS
jgi:anti-sigma factor RsiW